MLELTVLSGVRTIQLTKGKSTLVDADVFDEVNKFKWFVAGNGYAIRAVYMGGGRAAPRIRVVLLHRFLLDAPPGMHVDHADGDRLNNTRANLRLATPTQNKQNCRRVRGASSLKGVSKSGPGWRARIMANGKRHCLGTFKTQEEAAHAYDTAAVEHHGEFAATNASLGLLQTTEHHAQSPE